ncbi:hypothetical protein VNI00_015741 [Paramarasmius palmivorus]|uniref:Cytochrome P450 n=1 Tax=Paramarasmius palmivorus TaxID=297713 RepID=A0AAW0BH75_9AGAR
MPELLFSERYGDYEFQWQRAFGKTYRVKGCLGEDRVFTCDPMTLRYISKNNQIFTTGYYMRHFTWMLMGEYALPRVYHNVHRRIRLVMNTAFSQSRVQGVFPILRSISTRAIDKLDEKIDASGLDNPVVDVYHLIQHTTADAAAEAIMGDCFNALEDDGSVEVSRIHQNIVFASSTKTKSALLVDSLLPFIPSMLLRASLSLPTTTYNLLSRYRKVTAEWSDRLYKQKLENLRLGLDTGNDLLGISAQENEKFRRMMIAAQDTTGNTLAFALFEFARYPEWQDKVRKEIMQLQGHLSCSNLDKLIYLNAHIKETLRYYPALPNNERLAVKDALLPLSAPLKTNDGRTLSELHIKKGQLVIIGIASYNRQVDGYHHWHAGLCLSVFRDPDIWGQDAHEFDPYRWTDERSATIPTGTAFGPYANLATFFGGPHICLGWRLALLEMQVILADLLSRFLFEEAEGVVIRPCVAVTMQPVSENGILHLPLQVKKLNP